MSGEEPGKTSTGVSVQISCLLCYAAGFIGGVIFFIIERENRLVRFHALQSMVTFGGLLLCNLIIPFIPLIGWGIVPFVWLVQCVLWILLMVKGYRGEYFKLPLAGDLVENWLSPAAKLQQ
jgi:uncharacterized membrane protein